MAPASPCCVPTMKDLEGAYQITQAENPVLYEQGKLPEGGGPSLLLSSSSSNS